MAAQLLAEQGLELSWTRPEERRGIETMAEAVTVYYFCRTTDAVVKAATHAVRERLGRRGTLDLDDGEDEGESTHGQ
jgi:hypothetical protein